MDKKGTDQDKEKGTYPSARAFEDPPPAYQPLPAPGPSPTRPARASLDTLPPHLVHRILCLTLDPRATPSRFAGDEEEERVRRMWALFRGPRCVNRGLHQASTVILHHHFLREYHAHLPPGSSTSMNPSPLPSPSSTYPLVPRTILPRSREAALFNRFIATYLGLLLRRTESSLSEPTEDLHDLIRRLHPIARIEDLLLTLPPSLVVPRGQPRPAFPLPQQYLFVTVTPGWVTLILRTISFGAITTGRSVRTMTLVEVRRASRVEDTLRRIKEALEDIKSGIISWGARVL